MVMVCMCVLTDGVYSMCVLTDGERAETGCSTVNGLHRIFVVAYHIKFIAHILPNKVVAKLECS